MAKLINYQYLKQEVDLSQNVPEQELDTPIRRAQEMLSMIIGESLYNEIDGQHPNYSETNAPLIAHIKKFLAWQAYQFWLPKANFKTTASGLRVHREDNSDAATDTQMATLIRDAKMWTQTQKEKMVTYLDDNYASFPLYEAFCGKTKRTGTGFYITGVGKHPTDCTCYSCRYGYTQ